MKHPTSSIPPLLGVWFLLLTAVGPARGDQFPPPQIWLIGSATGGQAYSDGLPVVGQFFSPTVNENVVSEAETWGAAIREGGVLDGFYRLGVNLGNGTLNLKASAPTYAYAEKYSGGRWYWAALEGSAEASVSYNSDRITVSGPFPAGAPVQ